MLCSLCEFVAPQLRFFFKFSIKNLENKINKTLSIRSFIIEYFAPAIEKQI